MLNLHYLCIVLSINKEMRKAFVHFLWGAIITVIGLSVVFFIFVWNGWIGYMPDMEELQNPIDKYASQV